MQHAGSVRTQAVARGSVRTQAVADFHFITKRIANLDDSDIMKAGQKRPAPGEETRTWFYVGAVALRKSGRVTFS